jgi:hypothetical protein
MPEYYLLAPPDSTTPLAELIAEAADWEISVCPTADFLHYDGHRLKSNLAVKVPHNRKNVLLIWTWGLGCCLIHEKLIAELEAIGATGYRLKPGSVRFRDGSISNEYRQLVVTGWGGIASPDSGLKPIERCLDCHYVKYGFLPHPEKLMMDWSQWTGEDFFAIWPIGTGFITGRVADLLRSLNTRSYTLQRPSRSWGGPTVGRLSSIMPDDLAQKYGEPLGIEREKATWTTMDKTAEAQARARLANSQEFGPRFPSDPPGRRIVRATE